MGLKFVGDPVSGDPFLNFWKGGVSGDPYLGWNFKRGLRRPLFSRKTFLRVQKSRFRNFFRGLWRPLFATHPGGVNFFSDQRPLESLLVKEWAPLPTSGQSKCRVSSICKIFCQLQLGNVTSVFLPPSIQRLLEVAIENTF